MYKPTYLKISLMMLFAISFLSCSDETILAEPDPDPEDSYSPYISKVYDFCPAVGQFINDLPKYEAGDTHETMLAKVEKALVGEKGSLISLGSFGGYVVFGFDHMVENKPGLCDFRIKGNAFMTPLNPNSEGGEGGSCEPGVILVSYDANQNGLPDDEWYEIAGSVYNQSIKEYEITYYKPDPDKTPVPGEESWQTDVEHVRWTDNQGKSGYKTQISYHQQSYFPAWITEDYITFKGTLLPDNAVLEGNDSEQLWVLYAFDWGYADNLPNDENKSAIDIDWAVDKNGKKVDLPGIHFVKVYTGVNQEAGFLGEVSTEIGGAEDLHLLNKTITTINK